MNTNNQAKHKDFANRLIYYLKKNNFPFNPTALASAFNNHYKTGAAKPHTVRKWLLGETRPKSDTLVLLANWLQIHPNDLISNQSLYSTSKVTFEFDFTDQEVISKYLAMTVKQKVIVRFLIDSISEQQNRAYE